MEFDSIAVPEEIANDEQALDQDQRELLSARRVTPAEHYSAQWLASRNDDVLANQEIKKTLDGMGPGQYEVRRKQLDSLSTDERIDLSGKSAEEIVSHLEERAETERQQRRDEEALKKQSAQQVEATFERNETPEMTGHRKSMRQAYEEVQSLTEKIAELQQLNEMRSDPAHPAWDKLDDAEAWRAAREGKVGDFNGEIGALIQEKQAKLLELGAHQGAYYHEGALRNPAAVDSTSPTGPVNDQRVEVEHRLHEDRARRYAAANRDSLVADVQRTMQAGLDVTNGQRGYIESLPNGPAVGHALLRDHDTLRKLIAAGDSPKAQRIIDGISQRLFGDDEVAPRKTQTSAPRPPSPVSGGSSGRFDVYDTGGSADEWFRNRNAQLERRGKR
jgi:hypothetical protein